MSVSIQATEQAIDLLTPDNITPYQVISLLLDGALDGVDQAISRLEDQDIEAATEFVTKIIKIVMELRNSLNMDEGGNIAVNLNQVYEYIVARLGIISEEQQPVTILAEVRDLLGEVHAGWSGIADKVEDH